jgi:hypothetical protein
MLNGEIKKKNHIKIELKTKQITVKKIIIIFYIKLPRCKIKKKHQFKTKQIGVKSLKIKFDIKTK